MKTTDARKGRTKKSSSAPTETSARPGPSSDTGAPTSPPVPRSLPRELFVAELESTEVPPAFMTNISRHAQEQELSRSMYDFPAASAIASHAWKILKLWILSFRKTEAGRTQQREEAGEEPPSVLHDELLIVVVLQKPSGATSHDGRRNAYLSHGQGSKCVLIRHGLLSASSLYASQALLILDVPLSAAVSSADNAITPVSVWKGLLVDRVCQPADTLMGIQYRSRAASRHCQKRLESGLQKSPDVKAGLCVTARRQVTSIQPCCEWLTPEPYFDVHISQRCCVVESRNRLSRLLSRKKRMIHSVNRATETRDSQVPHCTTFPCPRPRARKPPSMAGDQGQRAGVMEGMSLQIVVHGNHPVVLEIQVDGVSQYRYK
ncbi:hypothetical protein LshimejAT787_1403060 [Lyophyllum shimeji]|uniref:Uncharacterized protein n=1 Tax=Lyophyllum shimeji TaxID=47721 RepID=A0A9P3UQD3_LYOSH|nr:hypothetical protein LshimejAT787_1403060 [Lyophyllum shimeji]